MECHDWISIYQGNTQNQSMLEYRVIGMQTLVQNHSTLRNSILYQRLPKRPGYAYADAYCTKTIIITCPRSNANSDPRSPHEPSDCTVCCA